LSLWIEVDVKMPCGWTCPAGMDEVDETEERIGEYLPELNEDHKLRIEEIGDPNSFEAFRRQPE